MKYISYYNKYPIIHDIIYDLKPPQSISLRKIPKIYGVYARNIKNYEEDFIKLKPLREYKFIRSGGDYNCSVVVKTDVNGDMIGN